MIVREWICNWARQLVGIPYRWGGNLHDGLDCSGFVIFCLRPFGLLPRRGDWTAHRLGEMFEETLTPEPGDLVLYGHPNRVTHVMLYLGPVGEGNRPLCIGATGGDSTTRTLPDALQRRAYVRIEPVDYHRAPVIGFRNVMKKR